MRSRKDQQQRQQVRVPHPEQSEGWARPIPTLTPKGIPLANS